MKHYYILIAAFCFGMTITAQNPSKSLTINAGTSVYVSLDTPISASEITLKSTSDSFSTLFMNEALGAATTVHYDRYVNLVGQSGVNGGNDLVALPVKKDGETYANFLNHSIDGILTNADVLPQHPTISTLYAFGPYNNTARGYTNYNAATHGSIILKPGVGYRAAGRISGQSIRFSGTVSMDIETVEITSARNNRWNSVGNPYPTYLDAQAFLDENMSKLDPNAAAIYGYNSGTLPGDGTMGNFTIINRLTNSDQNIAPGQGFLVSNDPLTPKNQIVFTPDMRIFSGGDDFILGKNAHQHQKLRIKASHATESFATEIYFNDHSSVGLDPGYDAALFDGTGGKFMLYTHLVKENKGQLMAIQSLGTLDMHNVVIPLGLKTSQGERVTFSIESISLPDEIQVYLEDKQNKSLTLLNSDSYTFTATDAISGAGRFFLRFESRSLSAEINELSSLQIFANEHILYINGQLLADTNVSFYDVQGRLVHTSILKQATSKNSIDAAHLSSGIYVVKLHNKQQDQTKKILLR